MRIEHLSLLRYGKFTDQHLALPRSGRDFHLIVGANEAGKSTTRSAILDLLFGIEMRTTFGYLHGMPEMRLGARLEHGGDALEFIRTKSKKSLLSASGAQLPDTALAAFLGGTDRRYFDQMFGLNHERLVAGGNGILSAEGDVGRVLFESAAGINRLGPVREQLVLEAGKLWAPRASRERAYYAAQEELATANAALKERIVRPKDYLEARTRVEALQEQCDAALARYRGLDTERMRLERVRRVAGALQQLRDYRAELMGLAGVVLLPQDAAKQLAGTTLTLASAEREQLLFAAQAEEASRQLALVQIDERVLLHEAVIAALNTTRHDVANHERDIGRRELEIEVHWAQTEALVRQLGWAAMSEQALAERLPSLPARSALARLIKQHGAVEQAQQLAVTGTAERAAELTALTTQLTRLTVATAPTTLRAALADAHAIGDSKSSTRQAESALAKAKREVEGAIAALGLWPTDLGALRALALPTERAVHELQKRAQDLESRRRTGAAQGTELSAAVRAAELHIAQYRSAHHPVSLAELQAVRSERDAVWQTIKAGERAVTTVAADYEGKVVAADALSDGRHDKATEVAELQSKLDTLQHLQLQVAEHATRQAEADAERAALDADWAAQTATLGVSGLALAEFEPARAARDKALRAAESVAEAEHELSARVREVDVVAAALRGALTAAAVPFDADASAERLKLLASETVDAANKAQARSDELHKQHDAATIALARQRDKAEKATAEHRAWSTAWGEAAASVGLPESVDVAAAETALTVFSEIDAKLKEIVTIQKARIETMQRDLRDFARRVADLVAATAPELVAEPSTAAVLELNGRLAKAVDDRKEAARLAKELTKHEDARSAARARVQAAEAALVPLLQLADVTTHDALRAQIALSDRRRVVAQEASAAQALIDAGGDGLPLEALEREVAATDPAAVPVLQAELAAQLEDVRQQRDGLTAELTSAKTDLAKIDGHAAGARAEAARQDALAKMANAAERYIKVHTASRLLKWAIDRYRETKQGPMLTRASETFSALTLGSFAKLSVDFDAAEPTLFGQRADGKQVAIAHLSDGTRDQLYLALRLAALEEHLERSHALPFIADDLFINYDDARSKAGLEALAKLSEKTQVIFLSHHDHLVPTVKAVFGESVNIVSL